MDFLDKFLAADFLWILYLRDGKPFRTLVILSSSQKGYQHCWRTNSRQKKIRSQRPPLLNTEPALGPVKCRCQLCYTD